MTHEPRRDTVSEMLAVESSAESRTLKGVTISGIASYRSPKKIHIRPLTLLAGANSAGKSSSMKPLLLLKQTLDHAVDPGPLLIAGANVRFASLDQLFTRSHDVQHADTVTIDIEMTKGRLILAYSRDKDSSLRLTKQVYEFDDLWGYDTKDRIILAPDMHTEAIAIQVPQEARNVALEAAQGFGSFAEESAWERAQSLMEDWWETATNKEREQSREGFRAFFHDDLQQRWVVDRQRCFLSTSFSSFFLSNRFDHHIISPANAPACNFADAIKQIIHVPAFRNNSFRTQPPAGVTESFPGSFEDYTASIIAKWELDADTRLERLTESLRELELTSAISTRRLSDIEVEVQVGRPGTGGIRPDAEMTSLADVGIGVSYVLPVLVALEAATPGQIVYVEQPESHLHPRAEYGLARALARASDRGVHVVAETHSSLLLLHIQTLVARGQLDSNNVGLHWFFLDEDGYTSIAFREPDKHGRTGDWPEDFADTEMDANSAFLRAVREH